MWVVMVWVVMVWVVLARGKPENKATFHPSAVEIRGWGELERRGRE